MAILSQIPIHRETTPFLPPYLRDAERCLDNNTFSWDGISRNLNLGRPLPDDSSAQPFIRVLSTDGDTYRLNIQVRSVPNLAAAFLLRGWNLAVEPVDREQEGRDIGAGCLDPREIILSFNRLRVGEVYRFTIGDQPSADLVPSRRGFPLGRTRDGLESPPRTSARALKRILVGAGVGEDTPLSAFAELRAPSGVIFRSDPTTSY